MRSIFVFLFEVLFLLHSLPLETSYRDDLSFHLDAFTQQQLITRYETGHPSCALNGFQADVPWDADSCKKIPKIGPNCPICGEKLPYWGYYLISDSLWLDYRVPGIWDQISYSSDNECGCYWPEYSKAAAEINDLAYVLFDDLLSATAFSSLVKSKEGRESLGCCEYSKHGIVLSLTVRRFHFSDYFSLCRNFAAYSKCKFNKEETALIQEKLDTILEKLYTKFLALYTSCYAKHPHKWISEKIRHMKWLSNDASDENVFVKEEYPRADVAPSAAETTYLEQHPFLYEDIQNKAIYPISGTDFFDTTLDKGILCNDFLLYENSIELLAEITLSSIYQFPPYIAEIHGPLYHIESARIAHIEKALAYFETDQIQKALKEYRAAKKISQSPPFFSQLEAKRHPSVLDQLIRNPNPLRKATGIYVPTNKKAFAQGLIVGTIRGARLATTEFLPSLYGTCTGILNGLWAFACSPEEVTEELVETAYAVGEFLYDHRMDECIQQLIPEIKDLSLSWNRINDASKGEKIGYIIGKYGIDILMPVGILKGVNKVRALKRANTMCTLERLAASEASRNIILDESMTWSCTRTELLEDAITDAKILTRSANVQYHVMQKKHAWEKVITLTGNVEKDFGEVVVLLEKNGIPDEIYLAESREFIEEGIIRNDYKKVIQGYEVKAVFETYVQTDEMFLKDAWVVTKK